MLKKCILLKFIYSEKATTFCEISTIYLSYVVTVKFTLDISLNFVAFSEYMNFIIYHFLTCNIWDFNATWLLSFLFILLSARHFQFFLLFTNVAICPGFRSSFCNNLKYKKKEWSFLTANLQNMVIKTDWMWKWQGYELEI